MNADKTNSSSLFSICVHPRLSAANFVSAFFISLLKNRDREGSGSPKPLAMVMNRTRAVSFLTVLLVVFLAVAASQAAQKHPKAPKTLRLYVFDCRSEERRVGKECRARW